MSEVLDISGAGVSLVQDDRLRFATSDDERVAGLERLQEETQEGPCVDAVRTGEVVTVDDLSLGQPRWPVYEAHAREIGVAAVAGIPMHPDGASLGALDLYSDSPRSWSAGDLDRARVLADVATGYLVNASRADNERRLAEQLQAALDSRIVIEQAKGIISAHRDISIDEAFQRLRKHANDHNATLRATAEAVVELGLRP